MAIRPDEKEIVIDLAMLLKSNWDRDGKKTIGDGGGGNTSTEEQQKRKSNKNWGDEALFWLERAVRYVVRDMEYTSKVCVFISRE